MPRVKLGDPIDLHVGARVRLRRVMLSMSQAKLGEQLGVSFQQVQKYEKGSNRIGASRLLQIARVLSVPVSSFFENAPGAPGKANKAERREVTSLVDFLSTTEGLKLNRAFLQIKDPKVRRRVVDLVRGMTGEMDDA
jgi:transcriptional regulator with XRE-family HTH domain